MSETYSYARRRKHTIVESNPFKYDYKLIDSVYVQYSPVLYVGRPVRILGVKPGETPHIFTVGEIVTCTELRGVYMHRFINTKGYAGSLFNCEYEFL